jgi:hypothetical protein
VSGAYKSEFGEHDEIQSTIAAIKDFEKKAGRRPRIMVAKVRAGCALFNRHIRLPSPPVMNAVPLLASSLLGLLPCGSRL